MNFSNLQEEKTANTREAGKSPIIKEQNFELRFRRFINKKTGLEHKFHIANKIWDKLGLETFGLKQINNKDGETINAVLLKVVDNKDAVLCKRTSKSSLEAGRKKSRSFKADKLESALVSAGVISASTTGDASDPTVGKNQYIKLVEVETPLGIAYHLQKDESVVDDKHEDEDNEGGSTSDSVADEVPQKQEESDL